VAPHTVFSFETPFKTAARRLRTGLRSSSPDAPQLTGAPTTPDPHVGPSKPPRTPNNNRLKTTRADGWFIYFRLYPTEPFFDRSSRNLCALPGLPD
jgi:hypothetical protein